MNQNVGQVRELDLQEFCAVEICYSIFFSIDSWENKKKLQGHEPEYFKEGFAWKKRSLESPGGKSSALYY